MPTSRALGYPAMPAGMRLVVSEDTRRCEAPALSLQPGDFHAPARLHTFTV